MHKNELEASAIHPLLEPKQLRLETLAYAQLVETLTEWLWGGATGGFIIGDPRVGKSWAARLLSGMICRRDGRPVPVIYTSIVDHDRNTLAEVPRGACLDQQLAISSRATADELSRQFLEFVCDQQTLAGVRMTVLIVDEFDLLVPRQFNAFAGFFNKLEKAGRFLMTVFIGNREESLALLERMTGPRYRRIRGRFFQRFTEFYGIRTREQLGGLMAQYDQRRFPENGPTYVEAFLPEAAQSGWHFSSLAKDLWRQYALVAKECGLTSWGMEYVVGTLNVLMTDLLPQYGWSSVDDDLLREAVLFTHVGDDFVQALSVKVSP